MNDIEFSLYFSDPASSIYDIITYLEIQIIFCPL